MKTNALSAADLTVSPGPHWHSGARLTDYSYNAMLALVPASISGIFFYGLDALAVIGACVATAMAVEAGWQRLLRRPSTLADGTAATAGMMLAMILPASVPLVLAVTATALGLLAGKLCFGGRGANPLHPALVGWAIVRITQPWAGHLDFDLALVNYDTGFRMEYPLAVLKMEGAAALQHFSNWDLVLGRQSGGIGAAATGLVLAGGLYLLIRGLIRWQIPAAFLAGTALMAAVFHWADPQHFATPLFHLLTGNLMLGAFFLSTDYASSPVNPWAMVVFGLCCGALTVVLRVWSVYPDGVVFACLIMSLFSPLLDRLKRRPAVPMPRRPLPAREVLP